MPAKSWTLTDIATDTHLDSLKVGGESAKFSVRKRTLHGGRREGLNAIDIDNGKLRFTVLPDRGMALWKAYVGDLEFGWKAPLPGPVHPQFVNIWEPGGIGWLSGFDEMLCRCGLESNGAPDFAKDGKLKYPLHGKIANLPAHQVTLTVDEEAGEITLVGIVDESRLYHNKLRLKSTIRTKFGQAALSIVDEVTNLSGEPGESQLLYHVNFGQPLLDPGSRVVAPVKTAVPRDARAGEGMKQWATFGNEQPGYTEQVYFFELLADQDSKTRVMLSNAHSTAGVSLVYNHKQLPHFTLWKSTQAAADGYQTGLEPATNFPNARSYETSQNRVVKLQPGETRKYELTLEFHADADSVAAAEKDVARLQGNVKPTVHDKPQPGWSAAGDGK